MKNKKILITGGTGSFGNKFVEKLLEIKAKKIIIFSRDEMKQWDMMNKYKSRNNLRFFLGDVRDKSRLARAIDDVDIVVHAAAQKIVPSSEYNPIEAIKTNILGAMNLIDVCIDKKVKKVVALSTDKACNPINLYGATKLASDKLFIAGNNYSRYSKTIFSVVRYGNVVGSRGSMVPFFISQKKKKIPFTLTHLDMTRFFTTLDDAAEMVIKAEKEMVGGEIFVNKNPSIKVINFLKCLDAKRKIKIIGVRPGEKIHETLITESEAPFTYDYGRYYKILPSIFLNKNKKYLKKGGKKCKKNFIYNSETNSEWLNNINIKKIILDSEKNYQILNKKN